MRTALKPLRNPCCALPALARADSRSGRASGPANTVAASPTSGPFAGPGAGGNASPRVDRQPVQGRSAGLGLPDGVARRRK